MLRLSIPLEQLRRIKTCDAQVVAAMVSPLGYFERGATLPDGDISKGGEYYTCKYQDEVGDCMIYANRPQMCRDYPNGQPCQKGGCTADVE